MEDHEICYDDADELCVSFDVRFGGEKRNDKRRGVSCRLW